MRFFGLYFSFFAFLFSFLASQNLNTAIAFGLDVMFWYFAVMSIFAAFSIAVVYLLIKKGVSLFNVSPFFKGLFEGASAFFILNFVVNRLCCAQGYRDWETDRKSTRLNSSHSAKSRMPSSA